MSHQFCAVLSIIIITAFEFFESVPVFQRMFVSEQRLEVVTVKLSPLTVDVSILPTNLNLNVHMVSHGKSETFSCQGKIKEFVRKN